MIFNEETADKIVSILMPLCDKEYGQGDIIQTNLTFSPTPEFIEALKQSDSPFTGFVLSCIVPKDQSQTVYNEWLQITTERSLKEFEEEQHPSSEDILTVTNRMFEGG